jgi:putative oxidoreductase
MASAQSRIVKDAAVIPPRLALGSAMLFHGAAKLRGPGIEQTGQFFEQVGIRPGKAWGIATGIAECFAGVSSILGVLVRPAALAVLVTQGVAIAKVHRGKGYENMKGGFEYNLALMAIAAGLLIAGPGHLSVHESVEKTVKARGFSWMRKPKRTSRALRLVKLLK